VTLDRRPCRCHTCDCAGAYTGLSGVCPLCAIGAHAPSAEVRDHLAAGAEVWARIVPVSLGSSGLSGRQLLQAGEHWRARHDARPCPLRPAPVRAAS